MFQHPAKTEIIRIIAQRFAFSKGNRIHCANRRSLRGDTVQIRHYGNFMGNGHIHPRIFLPQSLQL